MCKLFSIIFLRRIKIANFLHKGDIPKNIEFKGDLAIDTEAMGLNNLRDRLCLLQISDGRGDAHLVQFKPGQYSAPNLKKLLSDKKRQKIIHFARFDVAIIKYYLEVDLFPVYCTKIASRLARTYTDRHGLKDLCKELVNIDISKQQQTSNWGAEELTDEQIKYAASDVMYLHEIRDSLSRMLEDEGRMELANACFHAVPTLAALDLLGWKPVELFEH